MYSAKNNPESSSCGSFNTEIRKVKIPIKGELPEMLDAT